MSAADRAVMPRTGEAVAPCARCIRHENTSPLTYKGTNSWVLAAPGARRCVLVDPGPADGECRATCERVLGQLGLSLGAVVLTHGHADHAGCAAELAARADAPVLRADDGSLGAGPLAVAGVGLELVVVPLPGHSSDSVALHVPAEHLMVTGDVIFAQSPTMVCWPDGKLGAYLDSLDTLERYVLLHDVRQLLTAHGPVIADVRRRIEEVRAHRLERLSQVVEAVRGGVAASAEAVVDAVYDDIPDSLRHGAWRSVHAQLDYALECGLIASERP